MDATGCRRNRQMLCCESKEFAILRHISAVSGSRVAHLMLRSKSPSPHHRSFTSVVGERVRVRDRVPYAPSPCPLPTN